MKYENLEQIAQILLNANKEQTITNIVITCVAILIVYIYSRIKKSAELKEININFSNIVEQQKKLTEETEKIKQVLKKGSIEYQIKLSSYNEKSISAVNEIYISLINLRDSLRDYSFNPEDTEFRKNIYKKMTEFQRVFDINKIWTPKTLTNHVQKIADKIDKNIRKFIRANIREERNTGKLSSKDLEKLYKDQDDFYDFINSEILSLFEDLILEIATNLNADKA